MVRANGPYVRYEVTSPVTGTRVQVVDLSHDESTREPGRIVEQRDIEGVPVKFRLQRWAALCLEHDVAVEHEVLSDAKVSADDPSDWCARCTPARTPVRSWSRPG